MGGMKRRAQRRENDMASYHAPFEIHIHGQVPLRPEVAFEQLQDALKPLWKYAGARSLADGAHSHYEEEPGIRLDAQEHLLQLCWTVTGGDDFRQVLDEICMNLNELSSAGAALEVTFYDTEFDEEDAESGIYTLADGSQRVAGDASIEAVNAVFSTSLPVEEFDTIGGLVAHELGRVPRRGESAQVGPLVFTVMLTRGGAVRWFKVTRVPADPRDASS